MDLKALKQEIPYQWRVQSYSKNKAVAMCVAYIDARDVMELLDQVVGPENWQSDFKAVGDQMFAGIGISILENPISGERRWIWKWDTGSETKVEAEKGQASDSFKRAAVKWGIGRFLYDLEIKTVPTNGPLDEKNNKYPYVVDDRGQKVWDITKHINSQALTPSNSPKKAPPASVLSKADTDTIKGLLKQLGIVPATLAEANKAVLNATGYEFVPENYTNIVFTLQEKIDAQK